MVPCGFFFPVDIPRFFSETKGTGDARRRVGVSWNGTAWRTADCICVCHRNVLTSTFSMLDARIFQITHIHVHSSAVM